MTRLFGPCGETVVNIETGVAGSVTALAPDLLFFDRQAASTVIYSVLNIDPSGGLTTALSLSGKYMINSIGFYNVTQETVTVKLTIDGVVIINNTFTAYTSISVINTHQGQAVFGSVSQMGFAPFMCNSSLLLEIQTATDPSVDLQYNVRPIL